MYIHVKKERKSNKNKENQLNPKNSLRMGVSVSITRDPPKICSIGG